MSAKDGVLFSPISQRILRRYFGDLKVSLLGIELQLAELLSDVVTALPSPKQKSSVHPQLIFIVHADYRWREARAGVEWEAVAVGLAQENEAIPPSFIGFALSERDSLGLIATALYAALSFLDRLTDH